MQMRVVVGVTGASGQVYAFRLMQVLAAIPGVETHLVVTDAARDCFRAETDLSVEQLLALASYSYGPHDMAARISSGSFKTAGMIVIPCSMKTASAIANSYTDTLVSRAADVVLKERRKLVIVPRETPLHSAHLRNLLQLSELGAVVLPPIPAFYHRPASVGEIVDHTIGKILDQFDIEHQLFRRWGS